MRKTAKCQHTILGAVPQGIERKLAAAELEYSASLQHMNTLAAGKSIAD